MSMVSGNSTSLEAMASLVYDGTVFAGKIGLHVADIAINEYAIPMLKQHPIIIGSAIALVTIYSVQTEERWLKSHSNDRGVGPIEAKYNAVLRKCGMKALIATAAMFYVGYHMSNT